MKWSDETREAQGRQSIAEGERNKARVLSLLMKKPLTFSELKKDAGLSAPVLTKHLKTLTEEAMIQKAISRDEKVVYQVISEKKAVGLIGALFAGIFFYIVGRKLSAETMDSIRRDLEKAITKETSNELEGNLEKWEAQKEEKKATVIEREEETDKE